MRILRVFSRLNIGGPSWHVIHLCEGLASYGYESRLVVGCEGAREGNLLSVAQERRIDILQMSSLGREIRPLSDLRALIGLVRAMRVFRPTIVHTHTAKAGLLGRIAGRLASVPILVHTYHGHVLEGYFDPVRSLLFRRLEAALARRTDATVVVSEAIKRDILRLGVSSDHKIHVIKLGLQLTGLVEHLPRGELRRRAGVPIDAPLVGVVGRLVPIKDLPCFLRAAVVVLRQLPEVWFALVGDGEERRLLEGLVCELGLSERVRFLGWQTDLAAVLGDLDVVVNSSRNEGTPVALIEALAAGRPVVATAVGGTPDLLAGGAHGVLVPAQNPAALGAAIVETLTHTAEAHARARKGQEYVLAAHGVERLVSDVDGLYRGLLQSKGLGAWAA